MSEWPATKARRVLAALLRIGWTVKGEASSHKVLAREGWSDTVFAFHDGEEIDPRMLARLAKRTGLTASDLWRALRPHGMTLRSCCQRALEARSARSLSRALQQSFRGYVAANTKHE